MKRFLSALLMTAMVASTVSPAFATTKAAAAKPSTAKPISLKVTTVNFGSDPTGKLLQKEWIKKCEELLGRPLNLKYEYINQSSYTEKLKILFAGGDIPDLLTYGWLPPADLVKYGEQKMIVDLSKYEKIMPNYKASLDQYKRSKQLLYSPAGGLYGFYNLTLTPNGQKELNAGSAVRNDILKKHNLQIPTTLDEFYKVAKELKKIYPKDYPIILHEEWEPVESMATNAYKTSTGRYYNGKEYVFGPLEDNYKKALMYMNKLYKEGLISPDYFTNKSEQGYAAVAAGKAMMIANLWNQYPGFWEKDYPDQDWVLIPVVEEKSMGEPWKYYRGSEDKLTFTRGYSVVVSNKSKVKEDAIKLMDVQYSDEIVNLLNWGIEGETYTVDKATGKKVFAEAYKNDFEKLKAIAHPKSNSSRAGIFPMPQDVALNQSLEPQFNIFNNGKIERWNYSEYAIKNYNAAQNFPGSTIIEPILSSDENATYASIMNAVTTFAAEQKIKFITGKLSFDKWDKYISEINRMGNIKKALALYNSKM